MMIQPGMHFPDCREHMCGGCMPALRPLPSRPALDLSVFRPDTARRRPAVSMPKQLAPAARALLLAFYHWMDGQPAETLADPDWTGERLVDLFILEAANPEETIDVAP